MSKFGSILRCFNDDRQMVDHYIRDAKQRLFDDVDCDLRAMAPDIANDPLPSSYAAVVKRFVSNAQVFGFVDQVGGHRVINDKQVSDVFEDLILNVSNFSHVNDMQSAKAILQEMSKDVLQLNTFDHNHRAATLLLSHYQKEPEYGHQSSAGGFGFLDRAVAAPA